MALLTQPAIELLEQLSERPSGAWTATEGLDPDAIAELRREGLLEMQVWPPPVLERRAVWRTPPGGPVKVRDSRWEVRLTSRGALRLQRLRAGRAMGPRRA